MIRTKVLWVLKAGYEGPKTCKTCKKPARFCKKNLQDSAKNLQDSAKTCKKPAKNLRKTCENLKNFQRIQTILKKDPENLFGEKKCPGKGTF